MTEKVLDLSTARLVPDRPNVKLPDGKLYEMRLPGELGMTDQVRASRLADQLVTLINGTGDLTSEEEAALAQGSAVMIRAILPSAPAPAVDALDDEQRTRILDFFRSFKEAAPETPPQADGEPASPNSNGSTAEAPKAG